MNEHSCSSTSLIAFDVVRVLNFSHSKRCIVASHCFNLQPSSDKWCWHLFIWVFANCLSSLVRGPLRSLAYYLIGLFIFLLLGFKCSLFIVFWISVLLSVMCFANIFFQSMSCLFSLLIVCVTEVFSFNELKFINFFFHVLCQKLIAKPKITYFFSYVI